MGPRELDRLHAVERLQGGVAARLQQIVEELHVELVVLDDQDRLGHRGLFPGPAAMRLGAAFDVGCMKGTHFQGYGKASAEFKAMEVKSCPRGRAQCPRTSSTNS